MATASRPACSSTTQQKLRAALERKGCLPEGSTGFLDLRLKLNGGTRIASVDQALRETEEWLRRIAADPAAAESIVAAPMIKIPKGVILPEALLIIDAVTVTTTGRWAGAHHRR